MLRIEIDPSQLSINTEFMEEEEKQKIYAFISVTGMKIVFESGKENPGEAMHEIRGLMELLPFHIRQSTEKVTDRLVIYNLVNEEDLSS